MQSEPDHPRDDNRTLVVVAALTAYVGGVASTMWVLSEFLAVVVWLVLHILVAYVIARWWALLLVFVHFLLVLEAPQRTDMAPWWVASAGSFIALLSLIFGVGLRKARQRQVTQSTA